MANEKESPEEIRANHILELAQVPYWQLQNGAVTFSREFANLLSAKSHQCSLDEFLNHFEPEEAGKLSQVLTALGSSGGRASLAVLLGSQQLNISCECIEEAESKIVLGAVTNQTVVSEDYMITKDPKFMYGIFASSDDLLFVKDEQYRIVDANKAFIDLYPPEKQDQVIGFTTFEDYKEEQMREFVAEDQRAFDEGFSEVRETIDFPDGIRRTLLTRKARIDGHDGHRYIFGSARDISEIVETENSLEIANAELEEFAYRVSHDLRSPLVSSVKLLKLALRSLNKDAKEESIRFVTTALDSLSNLENLAKDILDLHKLKRGEVVIEAMDFNQVIADIWQRHHLDEPVRLVSNVNQDIQPYVDSSGMLNVLENLVSNAIKYHNPESKDCYVSVDILSTNDNIRIKVADNGIGIPPDRQEQLFNMFQRFHPRVAQGTGLGLYMVRQWVDKVGGTIGVQHLKEGTEFTLDIPQQRQE